MPAERGQHLRSGAIGHFEREARDEPDGGQEGEGGEWCEHLCVSLSFFAQPKTVI
jgi:hypothetical protein